MKLLISISPLGRRAVLRRGYSLPEVLVACGLGVFVLSALLVGSVFTLRSFVAMFNYTDMDASSCSALDWMSKDVRQATLISYTTNASTRALVFQGVNSTGNPITITYKWDSNTENVTCSKTGEEDRVFLTGCSDWKFHLYDRAPSPNYVFNAASSASDCKLVELNWTCRRSILGQFDTESIETAQIVLRN
jgi:Tfp pilus assembly protein PilW